MAGAHLIRRRASIAAAAAALSLLALAIALPASAQTVIAITHVTVIDGRNPVPLVDQTVILRGVRISAAGPSASTRTPRGARLVDGRGKYLVPGFWDMHVHTVVPAGGDVLPLYIANGVTGVRDMAGDWAEIVAMRRDIARGALVGPRMVASGP